MTDVFVNYRHADGLAAGRLAADLVRLKADFDAFIDTDLKPGDHLEDPIMRHLGEARVVLAVIGPEWVSPANLARLRSPDDWIRRELLRAWKNPDVKVVAVRLGVDVGVAMPTPAQLPQELHPLLDVIAVQLRHNSWNDDFDALRENIGTWLDGPAPHKASMPAEIPYLCNRVEQEDDLTSLAANAQSARSLVCVLQGHKWEEHAGFVSRLQQRRVLEDLFAANGANVEVHRLQWNRSLARAGKYDAVLRGVIKSDILNRRIASDDELCRFLRNPAGPMVVMLEVTSGDLADCGEGLLPGLEKAWQALLAGLGGTPAHFLALWLNVVFETPEQELPATLTLPRLTKLDPVEIGDIRDWMALDEVRELIATHEAELAELASDPRFYLTPGKIHMQKFVKAVRDLIPAI
ncbi:MAG: TIR domain-containing protein [Gammaproteobacteria bacterium]